MKIYLELLISLKENKKICFSFGDNVYDATMSVYVIAINKKPVTISASAKKFKATAKTKKYTLTLKTIKGSSADGKTYVGGAKKVTLTINGKTFTAKTNKKGQATFKITNLNKKGKFTAKISFAGDVTYKSTTKKLKITIILRNNACNLLLNMLIFTRNIQKRRLGRLMLVTRSKRGRYGENRLRAEKGFPP